MKHRTKILSGCMLAMTLTLVAGCGKSVVASTQTKDENIAENVQESESISGKLRTGLSVQTSISDSYDASQNADGNVQVDVTFVSVTVDENDVILSCAIDGLQVNVAVNDMGELMTDPDTVFESKNALGRDYGMHKASAIGKEWNEQAEAMAAYAVGKTVNELKNISVNEKGVPDEAELTASVTIYAGNFMSGIEAAVNQAKK